MESLAYTFPGGARELPPQPGLVGVVSSGNLEVLVQRGPADSGCAIEIRTAAVGFGPIWAAVMEDFQRRWQLRDVHISINDMGATPAVVSLRMDQAVESLLGSAA
jgi:malonate decarboxylase delta subunit